KVENAPIGSIPIDIDFPAARALPQLRYGRVYAARARAVDASGWSLAVSSPAPAAAVVAPVPFLRLDPVPPPTLAFIVGSAFPGAAATADGVEGPQSGESAERLAIRTLSTDPAGTVRRSRRLALPARTTFETAERHGMLDGRPAPELFKLLVERDRTGTDGEPLWIEKRNVALEYVPVGSGIVPFTPAAPTPPGVDKPEAPLQGVGTPGAPLPYLPDPLARKVRAWLVPISKTGPIGALAGRWPSFRPNNAGWEAARPVVVMLESGATGIRVEPGAAFDTLVVSLAPGEAAALHLAGVIDDAATARLFQIVQWAIDRGVGVNEAIRRVTDAAHWLVTPWRRVECVHAVDKPLTLPVITLSTPRMSRKPDSRHVELAFTTPLDLNSTGRLELLADWFEPSRDAAVAGSPPVVLAQAGRAFNTSIARDAVPGPASKVTLPVSGSHALAGTGYARIAYRAVASSRFREYMAPDLRNETPATPDLSKMAVTSAARSAFAPASSSPPAPVLGPIVPAFKWQRTAEGLVRTSRRIARTLRIDLGSRWFESGFNEMLAVLVPSPMLKVQASEIADDPLFPSVAPLPLAPAAFPLRRVSPSQGPIPDWYFASDGGKQHLAELNACPVAVFGDGAVVPHLVDYDQATGRFFADIAVSTKGFRPLVRLVLARYQPVVVPGCNTLSQSVSTDFLPLLPDRAAVLHTILTPWLTGESWGIRLLGPMIDGNGVRHRLRCTTQQLRPQASADFGWQPVDPVGQSVKFGMKPGTTPVAPPIPAGVADLPLIADGVAFIGNRTAGCRYRVLVEEFVSLPAALPGTGETEQRIFFETFDL
ncbi:MAG: hypothetical protein ACKVP3_05550, partial [Hyphomicrobiaceae bacterium]